MAIIFGIDGIGALSRKGQSDNHRNSFVRRIIENSSAVSQEKRYLVGPTGSSGNLDEAIDNGYTFVRSRYRAAQGDSVVLLAGYGRGAAGTIVLAKRLGKRNILVRAMLLFDAADRHSSAGVSSIPNSVKSVLHVRRHPDSKSQPNLVSVGKRATAPTVYEEKLFRCTHAAMGGMPWSPAADKTPNDFVEESLAGNRPPSATKVSLTTISYAQDEKVSREVWNHVQAFRGKYGFV